MVHLEEDPQVIQEEDQEEVHHGPQDQDYLLAMVSHQIQTLTILA